jgi:YidC/Oxa1 family membrane protein insertase
MFVPANIFQPLIDVFDAVIKFFHNSVGFGWGLSIVALTVCVRAVLIPLTFKQFRNMQAMQRLAPEMKAIQARYKDDKPRQQQEMMALYKTHKVNPFSSCLPLLLQLPVFVSLFYMLRKDLKENICGPALRTYLTHHKGTFTTTGCDVAAKHSAKFLFIPDLTHQAAGAVFIVLIVLYVGSQLGSSLLMASATTDKNQRYMMLALPFVFVFFIARFPAGLLVYWIVTNLWTIVQQVIVKRSVGPLQPLPVSTGSGGSGSTAAGAAPSSSSRSKAKAGTPAVVTAGAPRNAPRPPPRKKKKRSGRRR